MEVREWAEQLSPGSYSLAKTDEGLLCATVTTNQKPALAETKWYLDNDFLGLTPLSTPDNAEVDTIALTGLGGHALGSFRSANGQFVWLRDALPGTIPKARILTYGYDTKLQGDQSKQSIGRLAKVFLDALVTFRRNTGTQRRPLCFVAHSLGGVVLKEALTMSHRTGDVDAHSIVLSTYGLVLLGVPNLGLRHQQLMTMVYGQPNEKFIHDLIVDRDEEPSPYLERLTSDFSDLCSKISPPFHIWSYFEDTKSPTVLVSARLNSCQ
jgi:hypothetical protein